MTTEVQKECLFCIVSSLQIKKRAVRELSWYLSVLDDLVQATDFIRHALVQ